MKKYLPYIVTLIVVTALALPVQAQCKGFAKISASLNLQVIPMMVIIMLPSLQKVKKLNCTKHFIQVRNTVSPVCGSEILPAIEYQVVDAYKNVLYDNRQHNNSSTWDFTLESSQQLKVIVKVPVSGKKAEFPNSGCVSIMFGFQEVKK